MVERNILSRWWSALPLWRKVWNVLCLATVFLIGAAPIFSYLLSVINHDSFYDYKELWFYYPYLPYLLVPMYIGAAILTVALWFTPKEETEGDEKEPEL